MSSHDRQLCALEAIQMHMYDRIDVATTLIQRLASPANRGAAATCSREVIEERNEQITADRVER